VSLPFPKNESFVGREVQLQSLEKFLLLPNTHRRMSLCGLGGCGKSALALEFAYRALARHTRQLLFWVPAISQESFELAYREIGIRLRIPGITDDKADVKGLLKQALSSDSVDQWLMIVDNADDPGVLMGSTAGGSGSARLLDYLPYNDRGKILFTTRSRKVAGDLTQSNILELNDMSKVEARQLLTRRISKSELVNDEDSVDKLLELLTYLPLAIVQAAAFMDSNDTSASEYILLFQNTATETEVFGEQFEDPSRYREMESTIAKTWYISFDQIRQQDPLAAEYLSFIACIDRINIPQSLLPPARSSIQQIKAIGTLKGYAFITERQQDMQVIGSEKLFDMHRLVHMASEWWLKGHGEQAAWTAKAAARLKELIPDGWYQRTEVGTRYLSHALHVAGPDGVLEEIARASLLYRVGQCQFSLGQYLAAETTLRQVLFLNVKNRGEDDTQTLLSMIDVGAAITRQGKYEEAELMHRQTLARNQRLLGVAHPVTLTSMDHLGAVLRSQGKYEEAELIHRETLAQKAKMLGPEHRETLVSMDNLGAVLGKQGKYEEAELMHRETLARREKMLGAEHPETLMSIDNLGILLGSQDKYEEAELIHRQTLARTEKVLGGEHHQTLTCMDNLGVMLGQQSKYEEAELIHRQTLARKEEVLGAEHPSTLTSLHHHAFVLANMHRTDESIVLFQRAYAGYKAVLGEDHPNTRACRYDYSNLQRSLEEDRHAPPRRTPDSDGSRHTGRLSKLSRGLAKIGIESSMFSRQ
jgi:tetratricopeptide (TPR) repeat protein